MTPTHSFNCFENGFMGKEAFTVKMKLISNEIGIYALFSADISDEYVISKKLLRPRKSVSPHDRQYQHQGRGPENSGKVFLAKCCPCRSILHPPSG